MKQNKTYQAEISQATFKGFWPFRLDKATLINNNGAIMVGLTYRKFFREKYCIFAVNGTAIGYKKYLKAKELPMYLMRSPNKHSVKDIIKAGLDLNPENWGK